MQTTKNSVWLTRGGFKENTIDLSNDKEVKIPFNMRTIRSGKGDAEINRPGFRVAAPKARTMLDPETLEAIDVDQFGQLVTLSDKSLANLVNIMIPDPTDTKWLNERKRIMLILQKQGFTPPEISSHLNFNKPLNREQRKISSESDEAKILDDPVAPEPSDPSDDPFPPIILKTEVVDKISAFSEGINNGSVQGNLDKGQLKLKLFEILETDVGALKRLTNSEEDILGKAIKKVNVEITFSPIKLVDIHYIKKNLSHVFRIITSNVPEDPRYNIGDPDAINFKHMVRDLSKGGDGFPALGWKDILASMKQKGAKRTFFDFSKMAVISRRQLNKEIARLAGGFDNATVSVATSSRGL